MELPRIEFQAHQEHEEDQPQLGHRSERLHRRGRKERVHQVRRHQPQKRGPQRDTGADLGEAADRAPTRITPCLWFNHNAEEAIAFYFEVFGGGRYLSTSRYPNGALLTADVEVAGLTLMALNGGPNFTFNEAISLRVGCADQAGIDRVWASLTDKGGVESRCGWLKDRFGLSWQIIPNRLGALLSDADPARAQRAMAALMGMQKIDIAAIEAAKAG